MEFPSDIFISRLPDFNGIIPDFTEDDWRQLIELNLRKILTFFPVHTLFFVVQVKESKKIVLFTKVRTFRLLQKIKDSLLNELSPLVQGVTEEDIIVEQVHVGSDVNLWGIDDNITFYIKESEYPSFSDDDALTSIDSTKVKVLFSGLALDEALLSPNREVIVSQLEMLLSLLHSCIELVKWLGYSQSASRKDHLTGLVNKSFFWEVLDLKLREAKKLKFPVSLVIMDLNNFKTINDTYGHEVGDICLKEVANFIKRSFRNTDIVARYGGDEFVVIMPGAPKEVASAIACKFQENLGKLTINVERLDVSISVTASVGVVAFPDDGETPKELFWMADSIMYCTKYYIKTGNMDNYQDALNKAYTVAKYIKEKKVTPFYQPVVSTFERKVLGYEVFMRIKSNDKVLMSEDFFSFAVKSGNFVNINYVFYERTAEEVELLLKKVPGHFVLFINVSPGAPKFKDLTQIMSWVFEKSGISKKMIVVDITIDEETSLEGEQNLFNIINLVQRRGFKTAIDLMENADLDLLERVLSNKDRLFSLAPDYVKLPMSVCEKFKEKVAHLVKLANQTGKTSIILKKVENDKHYRIACELGVPFVQGYYIEPPMVIDDILEKRFEYLLK